MNYFIQSMNPEEMTSSRYTPELWEGYDLYHLEPMKVTEYIESGNELIEWPWPERKPSIHKGDIIFFYLKRPMQFIKYIFEIVDFKHFRTNTHAILKVLFIINDKELKKLKIDTLQENGLDFYPRKLFDISTRQDLSKYLIKIFAELKSRESLSRIENSLSNIWTNEIKEIYHQGLIPTEKHLQAELFHQMRNDSTMNDFHFWVEPNLSIKPDSELNRKKPDILISGKKEIMCNIELKYKPWGDISHRDDIKKLYDFSKLSNRHTIALKTDPKTGFWLMDNISDRYSINQNVLSVFAVIANNKSWALYPDRWPRNQKRPKNLLHLTGIIDKEENLFDAKYYG